MKSAEEIMEILAAFDLTGSLRAAAELVGLFASHGGGACRCPGCGPAGRDGPRGPAAGHR